MGRIKQDRATVKENEHPIRADQREYIAQLLRAHGSIPKLDLITGRCGRLISQAAARIFELEQLGWKIEHRRVQGERFVTYVLLAEPETSPAEQMDLLMCSPTESEFADHEMGVR